MKRSIAIAMTVALVPLAGCWKILEVEDDGSTTDTSVDAAVDTEHDPLEDPVVDTFVDPTEDTFVDPIADTMPEPEYPECNDGLDNDGDTLYDMDDNDCESPSDMREGSEVGECTSDNHCDGGWLECNILTNECYEPPMSPPCGTCSSREDCGDGIANEENPDVDWCLVMGPGDGVCTKDCREDFDCPRGFFCDGLDAPPGMCVATAGCGGMEDIGTGCSGFWDCGWGGGLECIDGVCTYECAHEHDCPVGVSCIDGVCLPAPTPGP